MGILLEHLEVALGLVDQGDVPALRLHLGAALDLAAGMEPYLEACTTAESQPLRVIAQKTRGAEWSKLSGDGATTLTLEQEMLSGHVEGQTLKMFVHMTRAKTVLDIGTFTGYSALAMAEALPPDGRLIACEVEQYVAELAQGLFLGSPHGTKISVKLGPALETLTQLERIGESFDLVFIDADKKGYIQYFQKLLDTNLLARQGFILVDNTLLQGQAYLPAESRTANGEAIASFNRAVAEDPRVEQVLLPLRDGLTIIRRL